MSNIKKLMMSGAAGGGGLDVDEVFSTYLYTGTGSPLTITNGIDLAGFGGMVWAKSRSSSAFSHQWHDTERGIRKVLVSNTASAQASNGDVSAFNSDGFSLSTGNNLMLSNGQKIASWTFRKAPKFFDVVTYTGNGVAGRTVSHNLGAVPGMIIIKKFDGAKAWPVYHRGMDSTAPEDYGMSLNATGSRLNSNVYWNDTAPTDSVFTVSNNDINNGSGFTYVAYVFAHNDGDGGFGPDSDQDIIKCGSYTGNGADATTIDLGFEAQWVLLKRSDGATDWWILDNMRGLPARQAASQYLEANKIQAEAVTGQVFGDNQGFMVDAGDYNTSGENYIYMAIRRGSLFPPESATEVFAPNFYGTSGYTGYLGAPADMSMLGYPASGGSKNAIITARIMSPSVGLVTSSSGAETALNTTWDNMFGVSPVGAYSTNLISWTWKRAPSFFDVVAWGVDGTGNQTINHNLGVIPEMVISKNRNDASSTWGSWLVAHKDLPGWDGTNENDRHILRLHSHTASEQQGYHRDFTDTSIRMISVAAGGYTTSHKVIAYLFATLAGVSKVGSYTGNGSSQTINCGFSSGARFVLIKRVDSAGDWYLFDTARGIVSGNDPYLLLNVTSPQNPNHDSIDPHSSGFIVNQIGTALNVSGSSYIFYAIA